jgi:hypothetical protein
MGSTVAPSLAVSGVADVRHVQSGCEEKLSDGNNPGAICVFYSMRTDDGSATPSKFSMNLFELRSSKQVWTGLTPRSAHEPQVDFYRICGTEQ